MTSETTVPELEAAVAWVADEVARRRKASGRAKTVQGVVGHEAAANHMEALLSALAASEARRGELEGENEQLRLAICGGEDAPGYAASLPLESILNVAEENVGSWRAETDRAMTLEGVLWAVSGMLRNGDIPKLMRILNALEVITAALDLDAPKDALNPQQEGSRDHG